MIQKLFRIFVFIINGVEHAIFTILMYALTWVPGLANSPVYYSLFHAWSRSFVRALGVDLRLHQKNVRELPEHYILIANHPSAFEDIGIPALFPVHSLAKIQVRDWWIVGRISWSAGTLFFDRDDSDARKGAIDLMINALKGGKNIALYPEGGCYGRRITRDFKLGAFDVSLQTGVPIVPVFLHYESQQDFEWQCPWTLVDKMRHFVTTQNNRANYYVYDAINPGDFDDKVVYANHVREVYLRWQEKNLE